MSRAENIAIFMYRLSRNPWSLKILGSKRPVQGWLQFKIIMSSFRPPVSDDNESLSNGVFSSKSLRRVLPPPPLHSRHSQYLHFISQIKLRHTAIRKKDLKIVRCLLVSTAIFGISRMFQDYSKKNLRKLISKETANHIRRT